MLLGMEQFINLYIWPNNFYSAMQAVRKEKTMNLIYFLKKGEERNE